MNPRSLPQSVEWGWGGQKLLVLGLVLLEEEVGGPIPEHEYPALRHHGVSDAASSKGEPLQGLERAANGEAFDQEQKQGSE